MKYLLIIGLLILGGCSWIESDAGKAHYSYTITMPDGSIHQVDLENAKDIGLVSATMSYGDMNVELLEQGVSASGPMQVMAESNAKMIEAVLDTVQ
jgi:hypothetical protein